MSYCDEDFYYDLKIFHNIYKTGERLNYINEVEFFRLYGLLCKRKKRYRNFLRWLIEQKKIVYFITLTFEDSFLPDSEDSCLRFVRLWLKSLRKKDLDLNYRINIDYGGKFGRIHLHAVSNIDLSVYWNYGFTNSKVINFTNNDILKVSNYCNKVVNHGFKVGACKILYSRGCYSACKDCD